MINESTGKHNFVLKVMGEAIARKRRVDGELVPADFEITIANISRTGLALISAAMFLARVRWSLDSFAKVCPNLWIASEHLAERCDRQAL